MKYFMLDIETMGTDFETDDIIQIALLEVDYAGEMFHAGRSFQRTLHTSQKPKNDWIRNTHKNLLDVCRKTPFVAPSMVRKEITGFFRFCGVEDPAMLMGLNATTFDVPYLVHKKYLQKSVQDENNVLRGDYHYRIYELKGAYNLCRDVLGVDDKTLFKMADEAMSDTEPPEGRPHEALYDCYNQLRILNGTIRLLRKRVAKHG